MENKYNFHLEYFVNGRQISNGFSPDWYGITENDMNRICMGVSVGMRFKYKKPLIYCYKVMENGQRVLFRTQR